MDEKQVKAAIRETKREMRQQGIKKISCFNGGLDRVTYQYNARLFHLSVELERLNKTSN